MLTKCCARNFHAVDSELVFFTDYALADEGAKQHVNSMIIDELNLMLSSRDYLPILLEVNSGKKVGKY